MERAALTFDSGAQSLVDGLCRTVGVPVTHVAIVRMTGFARTVDALGGLTVRLRFPVRDPKADLAIDRVGSVHVSGAQALALVRSRHPQFLVRGTWQQTGEHAGARARARMAGTVFAALRARARRARGNPITLQRALWAATGAITLDKSAGLTDLVGLLHGAGRLTVLAAAPLPRTIALLADAGTRRELRAAGYPATCTPRS